MSTTKLKVAVAGAVLVALLGASAAEAQNNAANYAFSTTTTGSLTDMSTGTTQLVAPDQDDTASAVTLMGFNFFLMGGSQDRFSVNSNGTLRLGATAASGTGYNPLAQAGQSLITAYGADQRSRITTGKVHFKVTGAAPNRVLIVEWLNMQANFAAGGTADLTYQVRLFETSGVIELVYGSMTMSAAGAADPNSQSPQIGFSSNNTAGTVGSVTAAQSGIPAPTFNGASAVPVENLYVAGPITVLTSAVDGSRRTFLFTPPAPPAPPTGLSFTAVTPVGMTLNWTDTAGETGYAVYNSTDGINFSFVGSAAQNATSFVASGLTPSTSYTWRVVANTEGGASPPLTGVQATTAPNPKASAATGNWSNAATWSPAGVPTNGDAVTIAAGTTVTIDTLTAAAFSVDVASTGILQYQQVGAATLTVGTNVSVQAGGTLRSNPAGTVLTHSLSLGGSLVNDGTLDFSTNADTAAAAITFTGTTNTTFSGTGATTDIRSINVNKGTTPAAILEITTTNFTVRGVTTDVASWLVMTNGTIKVSGTFAGTNRVFAAAAYTIPVSFGFWLNNPNYAVAAQIGNVVNNGLLRITQGTFNQGTLVTHSLRAGTGATFTIEGGTVNCAGQFSPQNAVTYNQSGGTLNVGVVGNNQSNFGTFELFSNSLANVFNMTGGNIVLTQASTGAIPIDFQVLSGTVTAASGTLRVGTGATATNFNFRLRGNVPNLVIDNTTNNKTATATAQVNLRGTTLINTGTTFVINGQICLVLGPTFTNNGTLTGTAASTRFYFLGGLGPTTYTGTGVVTAPLLVFEVDNVAGVTIDPSTTNNVVTARFNDFSGGLTGSGKLTVGNGGATSAVVQLGVAGVTQVVNGFDVPPVFNPGTAGVIVLYAPELTGRTTGPEMPPSRTLTTLGITNTNNITVAGGDVTINGAGAGALALGAPRLITGPNTVYFNSAAGTVTRTTGFVDGNFRKSYAAAANKTFEVGTANGYSPVVVNATAGTFPTDVAVAAFQTTAPGIQPLGKVISRYWALTAAGITADLTFNYLDPPDVPGTVTEANLQLYRHDPPGPANYTAMGGVINTAANTATLTGVTTFSDWTLAELGADLAITKTDGVATATPGGSIVYTITASNNGPGANPAAAIADNFDPALTCSTTCSGTLGGTCTAGPTAGNINDTASIPSGGSVTYTATCAIDPGATGTLNNTATVTDSGGTIPDTAGNNSASDSATLAPAADLGITKTDGVTSATAGGSVTYTITASNPGLSNAPGATVADTFPAILTCTWTCAGAGGGTCTAAGAGNINDTVNLPSGGSVTYTASCTISPAATGTLSNVATVTAPAGVTDSNATNDSAQDDDILGSSADLSITKTDGVTTATAGGSVTYTIAAGNAGPSNAPGTTVADTFPASLTCTWTCAGAGGGTCTAAGSGNINDTVNLPAGGSATYTASCTLSAGATGTLSNTATVTAPGGVTDPNSGNDSATDADGIALQADVAITKTDGVTTAIPGGSVTYTIAASNSGPSNANGTTVADTFPASLTCTWTCAGAGGGTCTAAGSGNINDTVNLPAAGGSATYTASCTISPSATGSLSNTATVAACSGGGPVPDGGCNPVTDPNPGNNSATDTDTLGAQADLAITKTDGVANATPGGSVTYTIAASNAGPSNATGATVADTFPASLTCTWTCVGAGGGTCTAAGSGNISDTVNLPVSGSATYTASCSVSPSATGTLSNTSTVAVPAGATDPNPGNNSATDNDTLGAQADLAITKTDGVTTVAAGGSVTYTIAASNAGPSAATGATVTDTFPASLTCTWTCVGAAGGTCTAAGSGNIGDTVNLPVGGSVTYTASCTLSFAATGTLSNTATVTAPAGVTDPNPGNNSATDNDTITVAPGAVVSGTKTVSGVFVANSPVTYTVVLSNTGTAAQGDNPGNELTDVLPAQLALVSATATSGTAVATVGTNTVTWNGSIPVGGSVTITITATILPSAAGQTVNNQGTISYDNNGDGINNVTAQTDDPAAPGAADPTSFRVAGGTPDIPTASGLGMLLLALGLAGLGIGTLRRLS